MKTFKTIFGAVVALLILSLVYMRVQWPNSVLDAPEIVASYAAKDLCSCLFVTGQSEEVCRFNAQQILPATIEIDRENKIVRTQVLWAKATGRHQNLLHGCRLM